MEGNVYYCIWEKKDEQVFIHLADDKSITVKGENFINAQELMYDKILDVFGDGEAVLNYENKTPNVLYPIQYVCKEIFAISGNDGAELKNNKDEYYDDVFCSNCDKPIGIRNEKPLVFKTVPQKSDGAVVSGVNNIYSENFLKIFSEEELENVKFREVIIETKAKQKFYELLGPSVTNMVPVKGLKDFNGFECSKCKKKSSFYLNSKGVQQYILKSEVPKEVDVFVVGEDDSLQLCVIGKRWRKILKSNKVKNIAAGQIGVINSVDYDKNLKYPII